MKTQFSQARRLTLGALVLSMLLSACNTTRPTPLPAATPTPAPTAMPTAQPDTNPDKPLASPLPSPIAERPVLPYTPIDAGLVAPVLVSRFPAAGERLSPSSAIEFTFDRAMDTGSFAGALRVSPDIKGELTWKDDKTLSFKPAQDLPRNSVLDIAITQDAKDAQGTPLADPLRFRITTQGNLEAAQTIPADKAADVAPDTIITVLFNRPVVPLTTLGERSKLPNPLRFEPPIDGTAEWLNTSVLVFRPARPLSGGTRYTGFVSGDLKDVDGAPLANEYIWSFTTIAPRVVAINPTSDPALISADRSGVPIEVDPNRILRARVDSAVTVRFNQPIELASARTAFKLTAISGDTIDGALTVLSDTLTFTPSARLDFDAEYAIQIAAGVRGLGGGAEGEAFGTTFRTVPLPAIEGTQPGSGEQGADPYTPFVIQFNTAINPETVMPRVTFTPPVSPTRVYTYYNEYDNQFVINFDVRPGQDYTVDIAPGITDPYGNAISEARSVSFRTRDAGPYAQFLLPYGGSTLNAYTATRLVAQSVNVTQLEIELYRVDNTPDALAQRFYPEDRAPERAQLVRKFTVPVKNERNKPVRTAVDLGQGGKPLAPGAYLVRLSSSAWRNSTPTALVIVSEINLVMKTERAQTFVWATDLKTGAPIPGLTIEAYALEQREAAITTPIGQGVTGADGVATIPRTVKLPGDVYNYGAPATMAVVRGERFSAVFSDWQNGINVYNFGIAFPVFNGDGPIRAHLYTERPLYRAGQSAFLRGIVRANDDFAYALPKDARMTVIVQDPTGNGTPPREIALDAFGAFNVAHEIPAGAALGTYVALLMATDAQGAPLGSAQAIFTVAAYRPPEFEVTVTPATSETVRGSTIEATANTRYLSGGPLANAQVRWNVLAAPSTFAPEGYGRYTFSDSDNPWRCFNCWWQRDEAPPQPIASGEGRSGADGALTFSVPVTSELRDARGELISGPVTLSVEANATGSDDQVLAGRASVIVHPASFYAGVAIDGYVIDAKKPISAELVAVDWAGKSLQGKALEVTVVRREWESKFITTEGGGGRWESEAKDEPVANGIAVTNERGEARFGFTPPQAGTYKITITSTDDAGRAVRASRFVWATGDEYVAWFRENNDRINLIVDKTTFEQGETAEILIPTPFIDAQNASHYMLVTVERGHIKKHEVVRVDSSTITYRVPMLDDYAPNIYVSAVLISGANAQRPDYKIGMLTLKVNPRKQTLTATLTPSSAKVGPGETVTYTLSVKDSAGRPVQGGFSLDLVDKGVLNLSPRPSGAIIDAFYGPAGLGVGTATGLTVSANRISDEEVQPQLLRGGGDGRVALESTVASPPVPELASDTAVRPKAAVPARPAGAPAVRENFADTAFWKGDVTTDANGQATIAVALPDNLTTWVMRAVGVDVETRVGEATVDVQASKPLLIRPVTPRFLVVGDEIELSAIVNNNTEQAQKAIVSLSADGVTLSTPAESAVEIPANGEMVVRWRGVATDKAQADLVFTVKNDQYEDSSKPRLSTAPNGGLKINRWSAPEVVGTAGELSGAITRTEVIAIPPGLDKTQGALSVRIDSSLAASMLDGLTYLEGFPYDCAEQTVSRFLPNVLTFKALKDLGIKNAELEAKLPGLVEKSIARLVELQNADGGWGWWKDETSNANISAYAVFGMLKAKQAGFAINDPALERGLVFLETQLRSLSPVNSREAQDWQTWLQYVLTEAGRDVSTYVARSFEARGNMSHYAKAFLILSMGARDAKDARIKTLLADLNAKIVQSATGAHWEERETDWWAMGSDTRTTAIVLTAIAKYDGTNKLAPNIVRWLMVARKAGTGFWASTHETAWALIALTEWMTLTGELKADYAFDVALNQNLLARSRATQATLTQTVAFDLPIADLLTDAGNRLVLAKGDGPGRLYYSAHVKAYLPVPQIQAADRGLVVQRRYVRADCVDGVNCPTVTEAKVGDVLRAELTLILPSSIHYLQLEDPLPAGAEAIDTTLATASQLDEGPALTSARPVRGGPAILEDGGIQPRRWTWWWNWWSRSEMRDDRVALFATYLAPGTYTYSYTMRVTSAGTFNVIPAFANAQYFPEVFGRSEGGALKVTR
jgi:hypothetical protein